MSSDKKVIQGRLHTYSTLYTHVANKVNTLWPLRRQSFRVATLWPGQNSLPFPDPCSNFPNQRNAFGNLFNSINDWMFNDMHSREYILCKRVSQSDTMLGRQHLRMSQICMPGIITMTTRQHWRGRNPMFFLSKIFHFNQHQNDLNQ